MECVICCDESDETWLDLSCGHSFHARCAAQWFRSNPACPLCRGLPTLKPVTVQARASLVRRFANTSRAPTELRRIVRTLRETESRLKERSSALRSHLKRFRDVFKEERRLRTMVYNAKCSRRRSVQIVGCYECEGMMLPPITGHHYE